jgi:hypothetical protein
MAVDNVSRSQMPNYNLEDILNSTSPQQKGPSAFRQTMGALAGGALNIVAPGAGSLISGIVGGAGGAGVTGGVGSGLGNETTQFLQLQRQMQLETRAFETASTVLKARHDAAMSAVRNIK